MEKKLVIRIPRLNNPAQDEPQPTALAMVDKFVNEWKHIMSELEYGSVGLTATVHQGRVVKMDVSRTIKMDVRDM